MSKTCRYAETLVDYISASIEHSTIGFATNNKLWLNGGSGPGGGSGGPPGGIVGQLIQRRVAYDTTESGRMCIEPSGSLLDNLNRIRWWQKPARWFEASPQSPRSMKVEIGEGIWYYDENLFLDFPGGESPTITLPTVNPRLDVVYVTESGVVGIQEGAEAADPVITMPTASGVLPIWAIYVTPTTAQIGWPCESYSGYLHEDIRPFIAYPGGGGVGVVDASYVVMGLDPTLTDERVLAAGVGISITDGGAGGNVVIAVVASGIDHGGLSGLADDDHPQYLLIDGSRAMASAANLLPTDAVGQELGAAGTRWDLFARNIDMVDGGWIGNAVDDLRIIFLESDSIEIRTDDANLYTFNENPSAATPMSATAAVINITGGDDDTGQDAGLWLRNEETNTDWSLFIDKSDYDHFKIARNATIVAEFDTVGNFIMLSGNDIDPEDASGQDLGSSSHRWDLYATDINMDNGGTIHCTTLGGPVITFNSITDLLGFTECRVSIGHNVPIVALDIDHPNINYNGILLASGTPVGVLGMIKFTGLDFFGYTPSGWLSLTAEGGGGGVGNHNLLSAVHPDTVAAACVRGYIIRGNTTPKWERYDAKTAGAVLIGDGNDIISDTTPTFVGLVTLNASLTFAGGGGANVITVPDNVADALHVVDAGALEFTRIVSTNANPYYLIDPAGAGILTGMGTAVPGTTLELHTGAGSNPALRMTDGDVSHPFRVLIPVTTDETIMQVGPNAATAGGMALSGFSDDDVPAFVLQGHMGIAAPANPAIQLEAYKTDGGAGRTGLANDEVVLRITNAAAVLASVMGNGHLGLGCVPGAILSLEEAGVSFHLDLATIANTVYLYTNNATDQLAINNEATGGDITIYATEDIIFRTSSVDPAMTILKNGNVGIGESTPVGKLELKTTGTTHCHLYIDAPTNYDAGIILQENNVTKWYIINDGNRSDEFAIGAAADAIVCTQASVVKMPNYGAGDAQFLAGGVITSVSDRSIKTKIRDTEIGLAEVLQMQGKHWHFTKESGLGSDHEYQGFIADDIEKIVPTAVGRDANGLRSLSYTSLIPAFVEAIRELNTRLSVLEGKEI